MPHISIKNIGPIKAISIPLNKVNVFIGPQSCGKSTLAKTICFCYWLEKDCMMRNVTSHVNYSFVKKHLINYYNLQDYFTNDSEIDFQGDVLSFLLQTKKVVVKFKKGITDFHNVKNCYIPSERNFLAIPDISKVKLDDNYLLEFITEWLNIRTHYSKNDQLQILNLHSSYIYNKEKNSDTISVEDRNPIPFLEASSGLQSIVPLCVFFDYLTSWIYKNRDKITAERKNSIRNLYWHDYDYLFADNAELKDFSKSLNEKYVTTVKKNEELHFTHEMPEIKISETDLPKLHALYSNIKKLNEAMEKRYEITGSNIVVEEPEQNIFPSTQVRLIYYMLSKLQHKNQRDSMVLTTHSPYILYALNNCMLASIVDKGGEKITDFANIPAEAIIDPRIVSVWEIENGMIEGEKTIQDENGLIRKNFFDKVMQEVMVEFSNLLGVSDI